MGAAHSPDPDPDPGLYAALVGPGTGVGDVTAGVLAGAVGYLLPLAVASLVGVVAAAVASVASRRSTASDPSGL